jgi:coenzyme F420-reducing hydrogenase beta subunit
METNKDGFYAAKLNQDRCAHCGLCTTVCSMLNGDSAKSLTRERVYVGVAKDKGVLERSSSGGVAHALSVAAIQMGMAVSGCAYDAETEHARHIVVSTLEGLKALQGSKYMQSHTGEAFEELLRQDSGALVVGMPCQIAGLHAVIEKRGLRSRFILVDFFCHGVPSQLLWERHLAWLQEKGWDVRHREVSFRDGKTFRLRIGREYRAMYNEDAYYALFLRGLLMNRCCYACPYRRNSRADIRIGDLMLPKYKRLPFSPSAILLNTGEGEAFFARCASQLEVYPETYDAVDQIQDKVIKPIPPNYRSYLDRAIRGKTPEQLIHPDMQIARAKAKVKKALNLLLRCAALGNKVTLGELAREAPDKGRH